ncbi:hypothetical protein TMU01_11020 [Tenuibacillus multivorans]|nr:hypothetical protein TMU01_11020 [Tenuibacillus multivorans]
MMSFNGVINGIHNMIEGALRMKKWLIRIIKYGPILFPFIQRIKNKFGRNKKRAV